MATNFTHWSICSILKILNNMTSTNPEYPRGVEATVEVVIRNKEGKILLFASTKHGNKLALPGGHIEPGEKIMDAAVRETKEEVGLDVTPVAITGFNELLGSPDFHRPIHLIYFTCLVEGEGDVVLDPTEASSYVWATPEEALTLDLARGYHEDLEKFIEYTRVN